jgi:hypothetical protein
VSKPLERFDIQQAVDAGLRGPPWVSTAKNRVARVKTRDRLRRGNVMAKGDVEVHPQGDTWAVKVEGDSAPR